jgi:hypothetical protein
MGRDVRYHFTDLESLVSILRQNTLKVTVNFVKSQEARGLPPSVSLTRDPKLFMYGPVRLTLDLDKLRAKYKVIPYEFDPSRHGKPGELNNKEELVPKEIKPLSQYLIRVDILKNRTWRREGWENRADELKKLSPAPIYFAENRNEFKIVADLQPPLGYPGGSCFLVDQIREEVKDPKLENALVEKVETGRDLSNPEAAKVYELEQERGVGPVRKLLIGPHTQYRMDWRGITVPQVRAALTTFLKQFNDWKSRNDWQYKHYSDLLNRNESVEWTDPRLGLTIIFTSASLDSVKLITSYWKGVPDPKAPGHDKCLLAEYRPPASELPGQQTLVHDPDGTSPHDTDNGEYKEQGLPTPPWFRSKPVGKPYYNGPGPSGTAPDGKSLHEDKARTLGKPGEDSPPDDPPARNGPKRRPIEGAIKGPPYPGGSKQNEQRGEAKLYSKKYYLKNKSDIKHRMKKWHKKWENRIQYKREKDRRNENPEKFERRPPGYSSNAERSKDQREKTGRQHKQHGPARAEARKYYRLHRNEQKLHSKQRYKKVRNNPTFKRKQLMRHLHPERAKRIQASVDIAFLIGKSLDLGTLHKVSPMSGLVTFTREVEDRIELQSLPLDLFLDSVVFLSDADIDKAFELFDTTFDQESSIKVAEMFYEKRPPDMPKEQYYDRGGNQLRWKEHDPSESSDRGQEVYDNPGSGKVIPKNKDFVNNTDIKGPPYEEYQKNAALIADILSRCNQKLHDNSKDMQTKLIRVDAKNNLWLFNVVGKTGTYRVRVKTLPKGNIKSPNKVDILASCSCPYWRWQGPEHWAKQEGYLYGKPVGTASKPVIKDPSSEHHACKHVIAVLQKVLSYSNVPKGKTSSTIEETLQVETLVQRYLIRKARRV